MEKQVFLLVIAALCVGLYFYGSQIKKDSEYLKYLPAIGGGAYALNFLVNLAKTN
jgi:hypothetical protein